MAKPAQTDQKPAQPKPEPEDKPKPQPKPASKLPIILLLLFVATTVGIALYMKYPMHHGEPIVTTEDTKVIIKDDVPVDVPVVESFEGFTKTVTEPGAGARPVEGRSVSVHYTGTLLDGKKVRLSHFTEPLLSLTRAATVTSRSSSPLALARLSNAGT